LDDKKPNTSPASFEASIDVLERIENKMQEFTPKQRMLAQFITQYPETVGLLSITKLAKKTGISESTIVRFCHTLGYEGYSQLGEEVQERIQADLSTLARFRLGHDFSSLFGKHSRTAFQRVIAHEIGNLVRMNKTSNIEDFETCIEWMRQASDIVIVGCLGSASLAFYFRYMLSKLLANVRVVNGEGALSSTILPGLTPHALVFLICFPRYPKITVTIGEWAVRRRAKVVALTDSLASPVASLADITFAIPVGITSFVDAYAAPGAFIHALVTQLSEHDPAATQAALEGFDQYAAEAGLFVKSPRSLSFLEH